MTGAERDTSKKAQIELISRRSFNIKLDVTSIIANDIVAGDKTYVSLFETEQGTYALCESEQALTLQDVITITRSIGLSAQGYYAPFGDKEYFADYGKKIYTTVFPSRKNVTREDMSFYQKLSPYSPALIRINRVEGELRHYNPVIKKWQKDFVLKSPAAANRRFEKVQ
jgi:hypothetical protein